MTRDALRILRRSYLLCCLSSFSSVRLSTFLPPWRPASLWQGVMAGDVAILHQLPPLYCCQEGLLCSRKHSNLGLDGIIGPVQAYSVHEMRRSLREHFISKSWIFFSSQLSRSGFCVYRPGSRGQAVCEASVWLGNAWRHKQVHCYLQFISPQWVATQS